eukprot:SAG31_NODE_31984_length_361_cov_1.133588_1_plen_100_part_00
MGFAYGEPNECAGQEREGESHCHTSGEDYVEMHVGCANAFSATASASNAPRASIFYILYSIFYIYLHQDRECAEAAQHPKHSLQVVSLTPPKCTESPYS